MLLLILDLLSLLGYASILFLLCAALVKHDIWRVPGTIGV